MSTSVLKSDDFKHYVDRFNADDVEDIVNLIPNSGSWDWMAGNIPFFACPDSAMEEMYYYRWWTFRKHIKETPAGRIVTEFITPVRHAARFNAISCALGHHIAEARWLKDQTFLEEYIRFWFRGDGGKPEQKFHFYSSWVANAMCERSWVTGDRTLLHELFNDLVADYRAWEAEKLLPNGLFWQFDVRDGMEESITGSRTHKNARPTINSYMAANADAIKEIGVQVRQYELAAEFRDKRETLTNLLHQHLWDPQTKFFKAQKNEGALSDAREAIGFIPWCFNLPRKGAGMEEAWKQLVDPEGFWAPFGITTAERRHPQFRSHGVGQCEWDGAVWPFATSQTLIALANVIRNYDQSYVTRKHYLEAMETYTKSQHWEGGKPYIGEYLDETTGAWLKGDNPRSRYYNHSTFADLVITGLVGLVPGNPIIKIDPLLPANSWDWFCLDGVHVRGKPMTVLWDRDGKRFGQGAGLTMWTDGKKTPLRPDLGPWPFRRAETRP